MPLGTLPGAGGMDPNAGAFRLPERNERMVVELLRFIDDTLARATHGRECRRSSVYDIPCNCWVADRRDALRELEGRIVRPTEPQVSSLVAMLADPYAEPEQMRDLADAHLWKGVTVADLLELVAGRIERRG